jgi:hypothetical protein
VPPKAEARFFDADAIAEAFGGILGPSPPIPTAIPTPSFPCSGICTENRVSYSPADPSTWSKFAASSFVVGLDVGMHAAHSAFVLAGVWPEASDAIGVVDVKQFALGTPFEDVADVVATVARDNRATVVFDSTNNSAFAGVLAARLPQPAVNWLIAAAMTSALSHAAQPTPMPIAIGGLKSAVRRWTLSKSELVETIAAELGKNSLRIARVGDWEVPAGGTLDNGAQRKGERLGIPFRPTG